MDGRVAKIVEELRSGDEARTESARQALDALGPDALHALRGVLDDEPDERVAVPVLGRLATFARDDRGLLLRLLSSPRLSIRQFHDAGAAAEVSAILSELREPLEALLPEILRDLDDPDPARHLPAATAIEVAIYFLGPPESHPAEEVAGALLRLFDDDCPRARRSAALALGHLGHEPARTVPALARLLSDPSRSVRLGTLESLELMGRDAAAAGPAVAELARSPEVALAYSALKALLRLEAPGPALAAGLARAMDPEPDLRRMAFQVLGSLPVVPEEAVGALREAAAKDPDPEVRDLAGRVLAGTQVRRRLS